MSYTLELGKKAKAAETVIASAGTLIKNNALAAISKALIENKERIIAENTKDIEAAKANGMSEAKQDRLKLDEKRIADMAKGVDDLIALGDPIGEVMDGFTRPNGLRITKVRVPLGVIGIIYESRPNVTVDAAALCLKTGNAVILKGGKEAINSNVCLGAIMREAIESAGLPADVIQVVENTSRETTTEIMRLNGYVDVLIPRGSANLIQAVVQNATVPVIETGAGNCHIYIDKDADPEKVIPIVINAKTQRIGVCNACESLVIHKDVSDDLLKKLAFALKEKDVEIRGDENAALIMDCDKATDEDFYKEYLDLIISVKTVGSVEEAIDHINKHSTKHSECIITENKEAADKFLKLVDSACVYHNVSTRFTDGFEFGLGAEIGISTQMLHARGPMGLKEMTTYKYQIKGNGQIR